MIIPVSHFLVVSAFLFALGLFGALSRRNAIGILMSIELILNSANLNFIAFGRARGAAGAVVGLALVLAIYRHRQTISADEIRLLKG